MKKELSKTRVSVKLRKLQSLQKWKLIIESYPVYIEGKPRRISESANRTVTTPLWEADGRHPRRDINGIIRCTSPADRLACQYADQVRILRQREYDTADLYSEADARQAELARKQKEDFVQYFAKAIARRSPTWAPSTGKGWESAMKHLCTYIGEETLPFSRVTPTLIESFKLYLLTASSIHIPGNRLHPNSAADYFRIFRTVLREAYREGYLTSDLSSGTRGIQTTPSRRECLTLEELNLLSSTPCDTPVVKRAALFSALTGLRHCDIQKLLRSEIKHENGQYRLDFTQKKTHCEEYMPISRQAYALCTGGSPDTAHLFPSLPDTTWIAKPLRRWLTAAGITRPITFHCFRHTYATLLLTNGIDIYTVSKMLGHTSVKTTQIYAKVVDSKKIEACEAIRITGITGSTLYSSIPTST